jgi:hypothetical protein
MPALIPCFLSAVILTEGSSNSVGHLQVSEMLVTIFGKKSSIPIIFWMIGLKFVLCSYQIKKILIIIKLVATKKVKKTNVISPLSVVAVFESRIRAL